MSDYDPKATFENLRPKSQEFQEKHRGEVFSLGEPKFTGEAPTFVYNEEEDLAPHTSMHDAGVNQMEMLPNWDTSSWITRQFANALPGVGSHSVLDWYSDKVLHDKDGNFRFGSGGWGALNTIAKGVGYIFDVIPSAVERTLGTGTYTLMDILDGEDLQTVVGNLRDNFNVSSMFFEAGFMPGSFGPIRIIKAESDFRKHGPPGADMQEFLFHDDSDYTLGADADMRLKREWDDEAGKWVNLDFPHLEDVLREVRGLYQQGASYEQINSTMMQKYGMWWMQGNMGNVAMFMILDVNVVGKLGSLARVKAVKALGMADPLIVARRAQAVEDLSEVRKLIDGKAGVVRQIRLEKIQELGEAGEEILRKAGGDLDNVRFADHEDLRQLAVLDDDLARAKYNVLQMDLAEEKALNLLAEAQNLPVMGERSRRVFKALGWTDPVLGEVGGAARLTPRDLIRRPWTLFSLTPASAAKILLTNVLDGTRLALNQLPTIDDTMRFIRRVDSGNALLSEVGVIGSTLGGRSVRRAFGGFAELAEKIFRRFESAAPQRRMLTDLADVMGFSNPGELLGALAKKNGVETVLNRLQDAIHLPESGAGTAASAARARVAAKLASGEVTADLLSELLATFRDLRVPYDLQSFRTSLQLAMADHVATMAIAQFGVQQKGIITKAADLTKAAEALGFLRLSPTYPIRNFLNNELTMLSRGTFGLMTPKGMMRFWDRAGYLPERLIEGAGPMLDEAGLKAASELAAASLRAGEPSALARGSQAIEAILRGDPNWMDKFGDFIRGIPLGPFDMARASMKAEQLASMRAYTTVYAKLWNHPSGWRPGGYFDDLTTFAERSSYAGARLDDEFVRAVHGVASDALGASELRGGFRNRRGVSFTGIIEEASRRMGISPEALKEVLPDEFLEALKTDLMPHIETGNLDGVTRVLDASHTEILKYMEDFADRHIVDVAEEVGARIEAGDVMEFLRLYQRNFAAQNDALYGHLMQMQDQVNLIRQQPPEVRGQAWERLMRESDTFFRGHQGRFEARLQGMIDAANRGGVAIAEESLSPFRRLNKATKEFFETRQRLWKSFWDGEDLSEAALQQVRDTLDTEYQKLIDTTIREGQNMDEMLYRVIEHAQPQYLRRIRAARETLHTLRKQYMASTRDFFRNVDGLDEQAKAAAYMNFTQERLKLQNQMSLVEREMMNSLYQQQPFGATLPIPEEIMDIFNRHHGGEQFAQQFEEAFTQAVKDGASTETALQLAAARTQDVGMPIYSRMENYSGMTGRPAADWYDPQMQAANIALREAEKAGKDVAQFIPGAAEKIHDPIVRMTWLDRLGHEAGIGTDVSKAAFKELSFQWRSTPAEKFMRADGPLSNQRYTMMSAETAGALPTQNQVATNRLRIELLNRGYDPIIIQGRYGGADEVSFFVPGMREQDAYELGKMFNQESVAIGGKGLVYTRGGSHQVNLDPLDFDNIAYGDELEDFFSVMKVGGREVKFGIPMIEDAPKRYWAAPLEGPGGYVTLYRRQERMTDTLDPHNWECFNGTKGLEQAREAAAGKNWVNRLYYYIDGTPQEGMINFPHRLEVHVPVHKIYDLGEDTQFLRRLYGDDMTKIERALKEMGFYGYRRTDGTAPNSVAIWEPLRRNGAPEVAEGTLAEMANVEGMADTAQALTAAASRQLVDGPRASKATGAVYPIGVMSPSAMRLRRQALDLNLPGLHEEAVDSFIAIAEARARTWAVQTGLSPDDWYDRNLGSIVRGTRLEADEFDAIFTQVAPNTEEFMEVMTAVGITRPAFAASILGSEDLPRHLQDLVKYMVTKRKQVLEEGFTVQDVTRSYLTTLGSISAHHIGIETLRFEMPSLFDELLTGKHIEEFSYLNASGFRMIRPEDLIGLWFRTERGTQFLDTLAASGRIRWDLFRELADIRSLFGNNTIGRWAPDSLRNMGRFVDDLNAMRFLDDAGNWALDADQLYSKLTELVGISHVKSSFLGHYFGFGERVTLDARQLRLWVEGIGTEAFGPERWELFNIGKGIGEGGKARWLGDLVGPAEGKKTVSAMFGRRVVREYLQEAIDEAVDSFKDMGIATDVPDELYRHAIHHWLWENVGGELGWSGQPPLSPLYTDMLPQLTVADRQILRGLVDLRDQRAIISAFGAADESTLVHELAHVFRRELAQDPMLAKDLEKLERWAGVKSGQKWTRAQEEKFADAFEIYLSEGVPPVAELAPAFERLSQWLQNIYLSIRGVKGVDINDDIRRVFDNLLDYRNAKPPEGGGYINAPGLNPYQMDEMLPQHTAPMAEMVQNAWWADGQKAYENIVQAARHQMEEAPLKWDNLDDEQVKLLRQYEDYLVRRLPMAQQVTNRAAQVHRDAALLNYARRTNFDHLAGHVFPFGFWTWNSAWNWLTNSQGHNLFADYFRITNMANKMDIDRGTPERFRNSFRVPLAKLPFVPDWMGDMYVNPWRVGLPFENWTDPVRMQAQEEQNFQRAIESTLQQQVRNGEISQADMQMALQTKSGPVYENAKAIARETRPPEHPIDTFSYLLAPHAPIMWAWHKMRGQPEKIGPFLPLTRTVRGVTSMLGMNGGLGYNPEAGIRRAVGLPEGDRFDEYRVERMLNSMLADGLISIEEFFVALEEKEANEWYREAQVRAAKEYAVGAVTSTLGVPIRPFPTGEERSYALKKDLDLAYENGTVAEFFDEYPEAEGRLALWDPPEERTPTFLTQQLWDKWHGLTTLEKRNVTDTLGEDFEKKFLNKETRLDPMDQSLQDLAVWSRTLGLVVPSTIKGDPRPMEDIPADIAQIAQSYYDTKRLQYFGINELQTEYFDIEDKRKRREFLIENPKLKLYWKWRRDFLLQNPEIIPYIVEDPTTMEPRDAREQQLLEEGLSQPGPQLGWFEWRPILTSPVWRLTADQFRSGLPMGPDAREQIETVAETMGMTPEALMSELEAAYQAELQGGP